MSRLEVPTRIPPHNLDAERAQFMGRGRAAAPATVPASGEPFAEDAGTGNDDVPF